MDRKIERKDRKIENHENLPVNSQHTLLYTFKINRLVCNIFLLDKHARVLRNSMVREKPELAVL